MSIVCRNFLENAWKKNLCSNCYKPFGDHELEYTIHTNEQNSQNETKNDNNNMGREINKNMDFRNEGPNKMESTTSLARTTWKSLIAQRNERNLQPFTLERGFHGQLLTVNKATNSSVDQNFKHSPSTKTSTQTRPDESCAVTFFKDKNKKEEEIVVPSRESKQQLKLQPLKVQSENETHSVPETVILKQTINGILKNKRSNETKSSVGFKEEEPIVIGYGGRDFTSEELEWEIASSDSEGGVSIPDETEEDRAFTKITKENTEFNSNTKNLLQDSKMETCHNSNENTWTEVKEKINNCEINGTKNSLNSRDQKFNKNPKPSVINRNNKKISSNYKTSFQNKTRTYNDNNNNNNNNNFINENKISETLNAETKIKTDEALKNQIIAGNASTSSTTTDKILEVVDVVVGERTPTIDVRETSLTNRSASVVNTRELSMAVVKNSCNKKSTQKKHTDVVVATKRDAVFTDDFESEKDRNLRCLNNNEPSHEAINIALADRHCMEYDNEDYQILKPVKDLLEDLSQFNNTECHKTCNNFPAEDIPSLKPSGIDDSAHPEGTCTNTEKSGTSGENSEKLYSGTFEPRTSFLHGVNREECKIKESKPSAIYYPGSDSFVKRCSSCSSYSSDESNVIANDFKSTMCNSGETYAQNTEHDKFSEQFESDGVSQTTLISNTCESDCSKFLKTTETDVPDRLHMSSITFISSDADPNYCETHTVEAGERTELNDSSEKYYSLPGSTEDNGNINQSNHYAEVNIYQEVGCKNFECMYNESITNENCIASDLTFTSLNEEPIRFCGNNGNFKRQAPSPPKSLPEDSFISGSSLDNDRNARLLQECQIISSASSTTSSTSQDDPSFGSWSLHGDGNRKSSKWKNSFLLSQYSKCKMLAMNCNEDRFKSRKKFSLKKLLKIGKDAEFPIGVGNNENNPKAWKYNDNFDKPRAKLEIIHPMDLENKTVTVNPGFYPIRYNSTGSFTGGIEVVSIRHSLSSDYGSYYSDAASTADSQTDHNSQCKISGCSEVTSTKSCSEKETLCSEHQHSKGSISPTPSRCSAASQRSIKSSSENVIVSTKPSKPPPPPRAHSLLTAANTVKEQESVLVKQDTESEEKEQDILQDKQKKMDEVFCPQKPQVPKRLYRAATNGKLNYGGNEQTNLKQIPETSSMNHVIDDTNVTESNAKENVYECVLTSIVTDTYEDIKLLQSREKRDLSQMENGNQCAVIKCVAAPPRNSRLLTKAPSRPPPIPTKFPTPGSIIKECPWKTLEGSYTVLSSNNKDILGRLIEQGIKRRTSKNLDLSDLKWTDIVIEDSNSNKPLLSFESGDKIIVYDADFKNHPVTLLVLFRIPDVNSSYQYKYPMIGTTTITDFPAHLLLPEEHSASELEGRSCFIYILHKSEIISVDTFIDNAPDILTQNFEKEIGFLMLQLIQELKSLQAQGTENIEPNFRNILLSKTRDDTYYTLVFLTNCFYQDTSNGCYSYELEQDKVSLCNFAQMLLCHFLKVENIEQLSSTRDIRFTNATVARVFENIGKLLIEERAVSLSQVKMILECFVFGLQTLTLKPEFNMSKEEATQVILHRWVDIERSNFIKNLITSSTCLTIYSELYSQFLLRMDVKNIKDILTHL